MRSSLFNPGSKRSGRRANSCMSGAIFMKFGRAPATARTRIRSAGEAACESVEVIVSSCWLGRRAGPTHAIDAARDWGLYISTSRGKTSIGIEEPALFSEPGVFLVSPDQSLYFGSVQTMPFMRPHFSELVGALDFAIANNYPARGEYSGAV